MEVTGPGGWCRVSDSEPGGRALVLFRFMGPWFKVELWLQGLRFVGLGSRVSVDFRLMPGFQTLNP